MATVRFRALLGPLLCLSLLAAACGGGDDADTAEDATTTTTSEAPATTEEAEEETTTTTSSTTSTTEAPAPTGPAWPLSGVPIGGDDAGEPIHPAVVVKISNNDDIARSVLRGLDQADIVFEERIEQSATRFAAASGLIPSDLASSKIRSSVP